MYYRGAGAAIVVYDITKMHSFRTLKEWVNELLAQGPQDIAIAIAGNKNDLENDRVSFPLVGAFLSFGIAVVFSCFYHGWELHVFVGVKSILCLL